VKRRRRVHLSDCERSVFWEERFREFNTEYFEGRLPQYQVCLCRSWDGLGKCVDKKKRILMAENFPFKHTLAILLHEMIHIKVPWHGGRFAKEWERIRKLGAPVGEWKGTRDWMIPVGNLELNEENVRYVIRHYLRDEYPTEGHLLRVERIPSVMSQLELEFSTTRARIRKRFRISKLVDEVTRELEEEAKRRLAGHWIFS